MQATIAQARKKQGLTQAELARRLHMSLRSYQLLESGQQALTADQAMRLAGALNAPGLTMAYCRAGCPIGQAYSYELLNNVDLSPTAILVKYRQEAREANDALEKLSDLMLNKRMDQDCSEAEMAEIRRQAHELLDLEHVIETLKLQLWKFLDMGELIREHNQKCLDRHYYKPALKAG